MSKNRKVMITCAVTGASRSRRTARQSPRTTGRRYSQRSDHASFRRLAEINTFASSSA